MRLGFPLLTTKKMPFKTIATELLWFLRGDTNIKYLVENGVHIWDGDAYKNYCVSYKDGHEFYEDEEVKRSYTQEEFINKIKTDDEFAKKWGDLGPVYGRQWRNWNAIFDGGIDQITNLINDLKTNPDSRRLIVNAWNVGELDQMVLPPCHYGFQIYTRKTTREEKIVNPGKYRAISLMWNQRSVDTPLGLPFNIASYALLLMMIADEVDMIPDQLVGNLGDCHIYLDQVDGVREQLTRSPMLLPKVTVQDGIYCSSPSDVLLENYESYPSIKFPLSN
jgi:thymidylate synthase